MTRTVGIVGVGILGGPVAANILGAGHTVIGYDSQPAALERLGAAGGKVADSVAAVTTDADVVITMLPDSPPVEEVVPGPGGVLENKDMGIALAAAREAGVALPVTGLTAQLIAAARAQSDGSLGHSVLLKVLENVSGKTPA